MELFLQTFLNGLLVGAGYALIAVGLTLVFGILGIVNFAHGAYFALGAYSVLLAVNLGVPYLLAVLIALGIVVIAAYLTELFIVRRSLYGAGNYSSVIVTFALSQAMISLMLLIAGPNPQPVASPFSDASMSIFALVFSGQRILILVVALVVLSGLGFWLRFARSGRQVTAVSQNARGALYTGINVPRIRSLSFMIGVGAAGLAGSLLAPISNVFPTMGNASLINSFIVVILGGMGSISGSLLGALLIGVANALFETYVSVPWTPALGWILVIFVLLVAPQGLRGKKSKERY
ncbi:branched-chain amino acid ABC transporter permease [Advenella mimigardefordensis]|uniref:Putative high-affinity branched-chain amino acid transport system permease protein BraD n=1 Tax=Advenella mimigardefordensis (strain DSM 17166 / LMG 22922 / DPN7) TaxID=1247726 RepID=W0PEY5_ADVMD|nr:branched-chain amino acid ABC transporter permease [Advenella mimigardefordensis]AHG64107.1 putative high-affinity branched-chain amino acid transport system permease protein BraD [Advenella mimigardefordensis DPN7]